MSQKTRFPMWEAMEKDRLNTTEVIFKEILRKLKTPLSLIRGRTETLDSQSESDRKNNAQAILDQVVHLENVLESVQTFLKVESNEIQDCNLHTFMESFASFFQTRLAQGPIYVLNLVPADISVPINEFRLRQVVLPLWLSSMETLERSQQEHKNIFLHCHVHPNGMVLSVEHNGSNSFTSKLKDEPGVSQSRFCAEAQGWLVSIHSRPQKGLRFDIHVPLGSASSETK